ncbi:MAG TPA: hypothetical protein VHM19_20805 [Polyangiales bacterium]|nr:hypothetical protein [Polyangiales bacterium]
MPRTTSLLHALASVAMTLLCSTSALAHDPPRGNGVWHVNGTWLIRTNRGLVISHDDAKTFQLLCNEALGINTAEIPGVVTQGDGFLIGTSRGLLRASADLCTLDPVAPIDQVAVPAVARDPSDAERVLASTGQSGFDNGLFASTDDGATFSAYGAHTMTRIYDYLFVSPASSSVLYASGLRERSDMMGFDRFFAESTDSGKTFTEHTFQLHDDEYSLELLGAHPTDTATCFGVAHADLGVGVKDRFLVSHDHAATFMEPLQVDKLSGFATDATGDTLWVAARAGLWRSKDAGKTFEQLTSDESYCVVRDGARLLVCDVRDGTPGLSVSDNDGNTLMRVMKFTDVQTMVPCDVTSKVAIACAGPWGDWRRELQLGFQLDGGVITPLRDAGTSASDAGRARDSGVVIAKQPDAGTSVKHDSGGCSCSVRGSGSRPWRGALSALVLGIWLARRRLSRRREL